MAVKRDLFGRRAYKERANCQKDEKVEQLHIVKKSSTKPYVNGGRVRVVQSTFHEYSIVIDSLRSAP